MRGLCWIAVDAARNLGATYADARIVEVRDQRIYTEDERVSSIYDGESCGIGVRVIAHGGWGFAATSRLEKTDVERVTRSAVEIARASALAQAPEGIRWAEEDTHHEVYRTPVDKDPFQVSLEDKIGLLLAINKEVRSVKRVTKCHSDMDFRFQHRLFANTEGSFMESEVITSTAAYMATAVDETTAKTRYFEATPMNVGYEHIERTPLLEEATRVGEEAAAQLSAKPCPVGKKDLILDPSNLALTMHESIGHATELDRVLGMEESLAGSSFVTTDLVGELRYGSPLMNIICDNRLPGGLATMGFDDDGVPGQRWDLVRDGILVDLQTNRETCHAIGAGRSRGGCRADSWASIPILRQSNFGLSPGSEPLTLEDLIADTKDGIYIEGMGSFSIDQKRHNFQFGGDCFWEINNGKKGAVLKDVTYQAITTEFWNSLDAICDQRFWRPIGILSCGKGDPCQSAQMSHASAPARFRRIDVGGSKR
jgi:TldD protein